MGQLYDEHTPVLIVGGGPAGLSAAVFLAWHGVPPLLVERRAGPPPGAAGRALDPRAMELFAQVGLADQLAAGRTTLGADASRDHDARPLGDRPWPPIDPARLERILRDRAVELGADIRLGVELVSLDSGPDGVTAVVEDGRRPPRIVRTDYLIAADGRHSPIRQLLGVGQRGPGLLALAPSARRPALPAAGAAAADPGVEPVEIAAATAERLSVGRVFLMGDAAHVMPPVGAFAAAAGAQDAHNLAWKIAAVRRGQAGAALLASYDAERRPAAELTVRETTRIWREGRTAAGLDDPAALLFGHRYRSAAVLAEEPAEAGPLDLAPEGPGQPTGRPGARAPHLTLASGGELIGPHALVGRCCLLLAGPDGGRWLSAGRLVADRFRLDLDRRLITHDGTSGDPDRLVDPTGRFYDAFGVGPAGAVLIRPDGIVAWRSPTLPSRPDQVLSAVLAQVLCREAPAGRPARRRRSWTQAVSRLRRPARAA